MDEEKTQTVKHGSQIMIVFSVFLFSEGLFHMLVDQICQAIGRLSCWAYPECDIHHAAMVIYRSQ